MAKFENPKLLKEMIDSRFINVQKHPHFPLWLYNYSKRTQQKDVWNEATCACRGMIMDAELNIVSRPFRKFFNCREIGRENIPDEPFTVTDKIDGSLGISYHYNGMWNIATRGSFNGRHAIRANRMLHEKYLSNIKKMCPEYTYLFEIIYPENRIIVDYGNREELVLLAIIDTETGKEVTCFENLGFPELKVLDGFASFDDVLQFNFDNAEGMVVRFESGCRVKVKFEKYMRLHKTMLALTDTKVWRCLSKGNDIGKLCETAGETYRTWIKATAERIGHTYNVLNREIMEEFGALPKFNSPEEAEKHIGKSKHAAFLLNLLHGQPIEEMLWKKVKPDEKASWFATRG